MNKTIDVKKKAQIENERAAEVLRERFRTGGTLVTNLISSPGSGKTTLLEETIPRLRGGSTSAVLVGDVATERDAERLRVRGMNARQLLTGGACHLDARQISGSLDGMAVPGLDYLFIENVGNLICPTSFDLGEDFKVVLLSVTEGDDKPFKYPGIFSRAEVALVTKADLLPHVRFDLDVVQSQVATLNPEAEFLVVSAHTGEGMDAWCDLLTRRRDRKRTAPAAAGK